MLPLSGQLFRNLLPRLSLHVTLILALPSNIISYWLSPQCSTGWADRTCSAKIVRQHRQSAKARLEVVRSYCTDVHHLPDNAEIEPKQLVERDTYSAWRCSLLGRPDLLDDSTDSLRYQDVGRMAYYVGVYHVLGNAGKRLKCSSRGVP